MTVYVIYATISFIKNLFSEFQFHKENRQHDNNQAQDKNI